MKYLHIIICFTIILSALEVSFSTNPVKSVLFLILTFCQAGGILILFNSDFFGLISIVIYVGAIAILFLFVIMMLSIKTHQQSSITSKTLLQHLGEYSYYFIATLAYVIGMILYFILKPIFITKNEIIYSFEEVFQLETIDTLSNIDVLGQVLFNYYTICFLLAGIILLIALIGSVVLTLRFSEIKKNQLSNRQLSRSDNFLTFFYDNTKQ